MALSNNLINQFVNVVNVNSKSNIKKDEPLYGTIVSQGGTTYVKLDGSESFTPVMTTVEYAEGERVLVNIFKHTATVIGNVSSPAVNGGTVKKVEDKVDTVVADNAVIRDKITASEAEISSIKADNVSINGKLDATNADIKNLKATVITADQADLKYATIENLNVVNETVRNLQGDYGSFKELTTSKITAVEGNITNLTSENATITGRLDANEASINTLETTTAKITDLDAVNADIKNLTAKKADIDLANVNNAWIQNGIIKDGSIGEAAIHEGAITNAKIADATIEAAKIKSINADTITAGTIKTERLIITGPDGQDSIVKAINVANGVSEADVNGKKIQAASIDVVDLSAFKATIAGFTMSQDSIYDGKTSIKDSTSGVYISTVGIGMGDGSLTGKDESPLQAYADGSFKLIGKNSSFNFNTVTGELNIDASSLKISSKIVATKDDVNEVDVRINNAYTEIENNKTEISLKASQTEVSTISNNLNTYIDSSTTMIQNANSWQFNFSKLIRTDEADVENHTDYITLQNGDIILGESSSDLKLKISNNVIQFKGTSNEEVIPDPDATAWITGQKFNINEGEIHTTLKVGNLQFVPRHNGNFCLTIV